MISAKLKMGSNKVNSKMIIQYIEIVLSKTPLGTLLDKILKSVAKKTTILKLKYNFSFVFTLKWN